MDPTSFIEVLIQLAGPSAARVGEALAARAEAALERNERLKSATHLFFGDEGEVVSGVQARLVELGSDLAVDGRYSRETQLEVIKLQARAQIRADGVCGPHTFAALWGHRLKDHGSVATGEAELGCVILRMGARGIITRAVQTRLAELDWEVEEDGLYGQDTQRAIFGLQARAGLVADGRCGPETFAVLFGDI